MFYSLKGKRIWVAGHNGMVGSAVVRRLKKEDCDIITVSRDVLDLVHQDAVHNWMKAEKPEIIIMAAAKVGGIYSNNSYPVDFLYQNLMIQNNIIHAAHETNVGRLLFLGSSCIYPKLASQPITEESLMTGPLEKTNEWYALAKIAGIKLIQAYRKQYGHDWISAMPTNLYGPGDNYDLESSHVLPALLRKFHEAKEGHQNKVVAWGTGSPLREFMHCDDLADALIFLLNTYSDCRHLNIGSGHEISIKTLADIIAEVVGYDGEIIWDKTKPDGTPRKFLDSSRLNKAGWKSSRSIKDGIASTYHEWLKQLY